MTPSTQRLQGLFRHGFSWNLTSQLANTLLLFARGVILARLLLPEDFGLVGLALFYQGILVVFAEWGFTMALVQLKTIKRIDLDSAFWINITISLILFLILNLILVPILINYHNDQRLGLVLHIISLTMILSGISAVHKAMLQRWLKFKTLAYIKITKNIVETLLAIGLAIGGLGYLSLALPMPVVYLLLFGLYITHFKWLPRMRFSKVAFRKMFSFGINVLFVRMLHKVAKEIEIFLFSKLFTLAHIGYYQRAMSITRQPVDQLAISLRGVFFPLFSRYQDHPEKIKQLILSKLQFFALIIFPVMYILSSLAEPVILFLFGDNWLPAKPFVQILSYGFPFFFLFQFDSSILYAMGKAGTNARFALIRMILKPAFVIIPLLFGGIEWFCWSLTAYFGIVSGIFTHYALRLLNANWWQLMIKIIPVFVAALITNILILILISFTHWPSLISLIIFGTGGLVLYWFLLFIIRKDLAVNLTKHIKQLYARIKK